MNAGIIGYGSIAQDHARAVLALQAALPTSDLRLTSVMGPHAEPSDAFRREFRMATATTDLDELLADPALDAVIVCSPSDAHAEQTERALRAGKHVLCEIPLALSLAETDRLTALADAVDRRLMVCHTQRYYPPLIEARRLIAAGELHPHAIVSSLHVRAAGEHQLAGAAALLDRQPALAPRLPRGGRRPLAPRRRRPRRGGRAVGAGRAAGRQPRHPDGPDPDDADGARPDSPPWRCPTTSTSRSTTT